eukprot:15459026-Alexandrium_andersonii.AAC.1
MRGLPGRYLSPRARCAGLFALESAREFRCAAGSGATQHSLLSGGRGSTPGRRKLQEGAL